MKITRSRAAAGIAVVAALSLTGCVANSSSTPAASGSAAAKDGAPLTVTITDDTCALSAATAPSGVVNFKLANNGTVRNEFEILAEDKLRIVGERENLGPGTTSWWWILLEAMFNLNAAPTLLQLLGWVLYIAIVLPLFLNRSGMLGGRSPHAPSATPTPQGTSHEADAASHEHDAQSVPAPSVPQPEEPAGASSNG